MSRIISHDLKSENEILKATKLSQDVEKFLMKQSIKKVIFVPNRLINIII